MVVESRITPEDTPALAAAATAMIDAHLARFSETERAAFWASIRKAYNTPYNPPEKPAKIVQVTPVTVDLSIVDVAPSAVIAQSPLVAEMHAA